MRYSGLKYSKGSLLLLDNKMDIEIKKIAKFSEPRGVIAELLTAQDIKKHKSLFGHLFLATFDSPEGIRGNHYHKRTHEYYIVISGKIRVVLMDIKTKEKKTVTLSSHGKKISLLRIGPNVAHACYTIAPQSIMIGYFSRAYGGGADTFKNVLIGKKSK